MRELWMVVGSTIWVVLIAVAVVWFILANFKRWDRPATWHAYVQNVVLTLTAAGALILVPFSLWNDYIAWITYQASLRPSVLFSVGRETEKNPDGPHVTRVGYRNVSTNECQDLRIRVVADSEGKQADLSERFRQGILFPAQDHRSRTFDTYAVLAEKGIDLAKAEAAGQEVHLTLGYTCKHFSDRVGSPEHQIYRWEPADKDWLHF